MTPPTPASGRADAPDVQLVTAEELQLEPLDEDTLPDPVPAGAPGDDDREPTIDTVPERAAAEQAARTDLALAAWRDESARRGAAFAERQARLDAVSALQRRQMLAAGGLGAVGGLLVLLFGAAWLATPPPAVHPAPARLAARPAAPTPVVAAPELAAPVAAAPVVAAPVAAAPVAAAPVVAAPVVAAPVVEPVAAPPASPAAASAATALGAAPAVRDAKVGASAEWAWAEFGTTTSGSVSIRWRDGAGQPALDPMGCGGPVVDGVRTCKAARSVGRIAGALAAGAAPGRWTVEACAGSACTPIGGFEAPLGAR